MSNQTTLLDLLSSTQANKEAVANALFDALSPASLWGRRASTTNGLTWGYYGGTYYTNSGANAIANGTVTLTASATNYVYANAATGAVSVNTTGFPVGSIPLYTITTGTTTVSNYTDQRSYQPSATAANALTTLNLAGNAIQTAAYTWASTDRSCVLVMNSATAVAQPLPTPTGTTGNFPKGWWGGVENVGAGAVTLSVPTGAYLDNVLNGTIALAQNTGLLFFTDGTNYFTMRGAAAGGGGGGTSLAGLSDVNITSPANGQILAYVSATSKWTNQNLAAPITANMDLISYFIGAIGVSQVLLTAITPQPLTLPASLAGSYAYCDTAPTGAVSCTINKISGGTTTAIGSVNFAAGATTGTFTFSSAVTTAVGDRIQVLAPASVDATFAGPQIALAGTIPVSNGSVALQTAAYTFQPTDRNSLNIMNSASTTSSALPTPTGGSGNYPNGWKTSFSNIGAGTATLTVPTGVSFDGVVNGTLALTQNQSADLWTDGTNWFSMRGKSSGGGGGGSTISQGAFASRPAAGTAGNMYVATDDLVESIDTGSAWNDFERGKLLTRPSSGAFTLVNPGGATIAQGAYGMVIAENNSGSTTDQLRLAEITPPGGSGSGSWTLTMRFKMSHAFLSGFPRFGLYARDSATGNIAGFWFAPWGRWYAYETYSSPTSWSARTSLGGSNGGYADLHEWIRLQYDGTNFKLFISNDGINFVQLYSVSATAWLTHAPTGCGIAINPSGLNYAMRVLSWTATTP